MTPKMPIYNGYVVYPDNRNIIERSNEVLDEYIKHGAKRTLYYDMGNKVFYYLSELCPDFETAMFYQDILNKLESYAKWCEKMCWSIGGHYNEADDCQNNPKFIEHHKKWAEAKDTLELCISIIINKLRELEDLNFINSRYD